MKTLQEEEKISYNLMFKLLIIGDSYTGKTNILSRYLRDEFYKESKSTIGVEFGSKNFVIDGNQVKAQIWDTAGQERYRSITTSFYKGALGALVCYDITRKKTFESIDRWIGELLGGCDKDITILLIGNKNDLENEREVKTEEGEAKAKQFNIAFIETSALNGNNIEMAFQTLINEIYDKCHKNLIKIEEEKMIQERNNNQLYVSDLEKDLDKNRKNKKCC